MPTEPCHRSPFLTAARSGLLSTAVHHLVPHQAQLSVKSWPEREAQSFSRHHKQQGADGQNQAFPPTPFPQQTSAHTLTGGRATAVQSRHLATSLLCSPLPSAPPLTAPPLQHLVGSWCSAKCERLSEENQTHSIISWHPQAYLVAL